MNWHLVFWIAGILWALGLVCLIPSFYLQGKLTVGDLGLGLLCSLLGPVFWIAVIFMWLKDHSNYIIWSKDES